MARISQPSSDVSVVDGASLFDATVSFEERYGRSNVTLNYSNLRQLLDDLRVAHGWRAGQTNSIFLSVDPHSEGQQRFHAMLRRSGFEPIVAHYRDSFVSLPAGRSPQDGAGTAIISFAARIAYVAGLMARHTDTQFLVVSHAFELFTPLLDLKSRFPHGRVGIAYFGTLLDYRWKAVGLTEKKLPIDFLDLDAFGKALVDIDFAGNVDESTDARTDYSRF